MNEEDETLEEMEASLEADAAEVAALDEAGDAVEAADEADAADESGDDEGEETHEDSQDSALAEVLAAVVELAGALEALDAKVEAIANTMPAALDAGAYLAPAGQTAEPVTVEQANDVESLGLEGVVEDLDLL